MIITRLGLAMLAASTLAAAAHAAPPTRQQIQALDDKVGAAVRAGDAAAVASYYASDATLMPSGAPRMDGQAAIRNYWSKAFAVIGDAKLTAGDVQSLGPLYVRELGTYALKPKGSPRTVSGKYVVIWKREGAAWKLWTDIWNSNQP